MKTSFNIGLVEVESCIILKKTFDPRSVLSPWIHYEDNIFRCCSCPYMYFYHVLFS
jgi:hypothetical protein